MPSLWDSTPVDGAEMRLYVSLPDGAGPFPGVVVIQHQGGVDDFVEEMTQRLARAGLVGVAPDLYHRDPPDCQDDGPTRRARLLDVPVIQDVNATVNFLQGHSSVHSEQLGIVGFCMGGRVAFLMAAANPSFKAAVSYYGGNTMVPWGAGAAPFDRIAEIHCPLLPMRAGMHPHTPSPRRRPAELGKGPADR